ncbi:DUF983 domain-containing protein [Lichenibacterium dinghuense]|uniref:DUF983 domain-containing protein n=1 Tax=Lichenibacterium dinghuense TaxID=2895977 RepID=UPI001F3D6236|nr:DUF983 domain-containing protein [Lichenibacterium sp. 6Y81]
METDAQTYSYGEEAAPPERSLAAAMLRGALCRCPACGAGGLYRAYLKPVDACRACGEELHHQRADDAPPYVTIFFAGHLIVAAVVGIDIAYAWPLWLHAMVWLPATVALCLGLLPVVKGALIGLQWALRMHGFGGAAEAADTHPALDAGIGGASAHR